jgi:hypothetical protein
MSSPRRPLPQGLVLATCAIVGAVAALAALLAWAGDDEVPAAAPDAAVTTTTPPSTTAPPGTPPPSTGPGPEPVACPDGVPQPVCEAADYVQRETGRPFRQFPAVDLEDDEGFVARLMEGADEELAEVEAFGQTMIALGLLDADVDVVTSLRELYSVGVVGFYDPEEDVLVVKGANYSPYTRIVLVHELVHALDDQWFDLDRPEQEDAGSEAAFGFSALVEGHARVLENRYRGQLTADQQREATREELRMVLGAGVDLASLPPVLVDMLGAPYELGEPLVDAVLASGGEDAVAEAFARPPATSEQVLHPELYASGEAAVDVPVPPADGPVVEEEVIGEHGLRLLLHDEDAARGWGGDHYVTWTDAGRVCTRIDVVFDTGADLAEARGPLARSGRTVEDATIAGRSGLRVTSCTPT